MKRRRNRRRRLPPGPLPPGPLPRLRAAYGFRKAQAAALVVGRPVLLRRATAYSLYNVARQLGMRCSLRRLAVGPSSPVWLTRIQ